MKPLVLELDDRAVSLARSGQVLSSAPAVVFDSGLNVPVGTNAWHAVRRHPTATSTRHVGAAVSRTDAPRAMTLLAAELRTRLADHPPAEGERMWIAAPARAEAAGLGAVLEVARSLSLPVDGFVDAAAVSVAGLGLDRGSLVLELGLHHVAVTAVDSGSHARRRRAVVSTRGGLIELYETWLDLISTAMVKRTRFDPLHDAAHEQQLFDALPELARQAATTGATTAVMAVGGERFDTPLSRDQFVQAAQPVYREVLRLLHELRPAGATLDLLVPQAAAALPGLRDALEQFVGCELLVAPDGLAAAAASLLDLPERADQDPVRLLRRVPAEAREELGAQVTREPLGRQATHEAPASHVLFEGRAYALNARELVVGRGSEALATICLAEGLAGVSRRHCTFVRDGSELQLIDHSSFGTFVNGERVAERVRVRAGDRVRVGDPGVELSLISVGDTASGEAR